jgi:uncharacterized protein HemY
MSRHKNYKASRDNPANSHERQRQEQAALDELLRHGGSKTDAENLRAHFKEAEPEDRSNLEIPE